MKYWMLPLVLLAGCATASVDRYKIIPVETVKVKKVYSKRSCPPLPSLDESASREELTAHHLKVIKLYKECAK